jgi:hypothetical protein
MRKIADHKSWESKLLPNAREYLRRSNDEFPRKLASLRKTVPVESVENLESGNLNWLSFYRLMHGPEATEEFRKVFSGAMKARLEGRPIKYEGLEIPHLWIFQYEQLFILNHLLHPVILLHRIKKGDEKAFLDFVKVDKSILASDVARHFISPAQLKGDKKFFQKLSKSLLYDPRKLPFPKVKLFHFLLTIGGLSITKLTIPEICDVLEDCCGMTVEDPETVRKFWNRHNLHRNPFQTFESGK